MHWSSISLCPQDELTKSTEFPQVLPVDLTRTMDPKSEAIVNTSNVGAPRKLAFSVENILDPTKFTGRKESNCDNAASNDRNNNSQSLYPTGNDSYGPGDDDISQTGKWMCG